MCSMITLKGTVTNARGMAGTRAAIVKRIKVPIPMGDKFMACTLATME